MADPCRLGTFDSGKVFEQALVNRRHRLGSPHNHVSLIALSIVRNQSSAKSDLRFSNTELGFELGTLHRRHGAILTLNNVYESPILLN